MVEDGPLRERLGFLEEEMQRARRLGWQLLAAGALFWILLPVLGIMGFWAGDGVSGAAAFALVGGAAQGFGLALLDSSRRLGREAHMLRRQLAAPPDAEP